MDLSIIDTTCAVLSLLISVYTLTQVVKIKTTINSNNQIGNDNSKTSVKQSAKGKGNIQAGGDING